MLHAYRYLVQIARTWTAAQIGALPIIVGMMADLGLPVSSCSCSYNGVTVYPFIRVDVDEGAAVATATLVARWYRVSDLQVGDVDLRDVAKVLVGEADRTRVAVAICEALTSGGDLPPVLVVRT